MKTLQKKYDVVVMVADRGVFPLLSPPAEMVQRFCW